MKEWEKKCYSKGIPDELPNCIERKTSQPSYKKIVMSILKNDVVLKSLGKTGKKSQVYNDIKREELIRNGKIKVIQKKLF